MKIPCRPKDPDRQPWWDAACELEMQIANRRYLASKRRDRGSRKSKGLFRQVVQRAVQRDSETMTRVLAMQKAVADITTVVLTDWVETPLYSTVSL